VLQYGDFVREPAVILEKLLQHAGIPVRCQTAEPQSKRFGPNGVCIDSIAARRAWRPAFFRAPSGHFARMLSYYPATAGRQDKLIGA
jgi:hypothetical protein